MRLRSFFYDKNALIPLICEDPEAKILGTVGEDPNDLQTDERLNSSTGLDLHRYFCTLSWLSSNDYTFLGPKHHEQVIENHVHPYAFSQAHSLYYFRTYRNKKMMSSIEISDYFRVCRMTVVTYQ